MAKSSSNTKGAAKGSRAAAKMKTAKARPMEGPAGRRLERKASTAAKAKPAARTVESTAVKRDRATGRRIPERTSGTNQQGRQGAGPAPLRPIPKRQSRDQILATVAADSGVERPIVERVARSLSQTVQRHLMRNGSGRIEIPYLGAALWRGQEGARPARKMASPILGGRIVNIPAKRATAVARIRVHSALREIVARA